jgi:hypothetical protein
MSGFVAAPAITLDPVMLDHATHSTVTLTSFTEIVFNSPALPAAAVADHMVGFAATYTLAAPPIMLRCAAITSRAPAINPHVANAVAHWKYYKIKSQHN